MQKNCIFSWTVGSLPPLQGEGLISVYPIDAYTKTQKFNVIASHFILTICMYFHFEHFYREIVLQCPLRFEELHFLAPKVPYRPYRLLFLASISSNTIQQLLQTVCIWQYWLREDTHKIKRFFWSDHYALRKPQAPTSPYNF